ncbi:MAG: endo-1,4-beta-xylanase [Treponema sp.]|jgi:endo-1,4-beta-xylanase|nr:endo-1,4-beta-xylanase [Treponema sp.]
MIKKILFFSVIAVFMFSGFLSCNQNRAPRKGVILEKRELVLTIGASEKLEYILTPEAEGQTLVWVSSDPNIVRVSEDGVVTAVNFSTGGSMAYASIFGTGQANVTVSTENGKFKDTIKIAATTQGQVNILSLPPIKDQFSSYFIMGNIYNPADASPAEIVTEHLIYHYSMLTPENNMKPSYLAPDPNSYNFQTADRMVNAALASGLKVHGHTLLWHSQNSAWIKRVPDRYNKDQALVVMKKYITDVVTHFKGRIYSWDVLNEVFPDGVSSRGDWRQVMRKENPWYAAIGADFVYEGFLAARLADPNVILYYNDYNTDQAPKAAMIRDMVRDVNERYRREYPNANRLLIEGIGMQEHHNTGVTASSIRATINLFRPLGVKISVAELDVLGQSWSTFRDIGAGIDKHGTSTVTNEGLMDQARLYGEYMKLYMENADIIERVSLWGVTDDKSWRSGGLPLLFDSQGRAKPAYYSFVGALDN